MLPDKILPDKISETFFKNIQNGQRYLLGAGKYIGYFNIGTKTTLNFRNIKIFFLERHWVTMDDCKCFRGEGVEGRDQNAISKMFISFCEAVIEIIGLPLIKLLRHFLKMQKQISEFVIPFIILKVFRSIDRTHIL